MYRRGFRQQKLAAGLEKKGRRLVAKPGKANAIGGRKSGGFRHK
jgi:hypothetical protein